jgi:hypothetical protein
VGKSWIRRGPGGQIAPNKSKPGEADQNDIAALMALPVAGRPALSVLWCFVMAGLDPAIHENTEHGVQADVDVS